MKNVGGLDRNLRILFGAAALCFGAFAPIRWKWRLSAISLGAGQVMTGLRGYCPLNAALGINTRQNRTLSAAAERNLMRTERLTR